MKKFLILLIMVIFLCGCVEKRIVDEINIAIASGFDPSDGDKKFKTTFLMQDFQEDMSVQNRTITSEGDVRREILIGSNRQSPSPVVVGGMRLTLFEKSIAKKGIKDYIDTYQRDATIGTRIFFATTEGKTEELLKGNYGPQGNGSFISDLIEHNIRQGDVPKTNLASFLQDYYQKGKDVYLPHIKKINDKNVDISGLMLFKGSKALYILPSEKMFYFKLLVDRYSKGEFTVSLEDGSKASVHSIISKHRLKMDKKDPLHLSIEINIKGNIKEYTGNKLNPKIVEAITKNLEEKVEKECIQLVKEFQEKEIDPVGIGAYYKTQIRGFDYEKWKQTYTDLSVDIKSDVEIIETGATY
ncbi:Ger(x)C family spore germination protein [Cytobacillus horneckiae]|uniref:Ger(x)C family spore germination protein n=1 Tax=Cytobacillus horneckiae TaxID=549687 RepID=UPI00399F37F5